MNTEHTTETWTAYQNPEDIRTNLWHIRVAEGLGGSMRGYCGEKRARLIAAAPDLLEALKDILSGWRYIRQDAAHQSIYGVGWDRAQQAAEAAIAKAEGKA
jgi:hypothetical protein